MKLGVVMEGGASRTVFSCGVTDCLLEEEIMPDYLIGVSAGIAYGVSYLSRQKGRNRIIFEKYMSDKRYMGMKYLLDRNMKSYYNVPFVFGEIPNKLVPFDYEAFAAYPGEVEAVVTNIHNGQAEYLPVPRDDKNIVILTRPREYVKRPEQAFKVIAKLYKKYPKVVEALQNRADVYNQCTLELYQAEKEGKGEYARIA